MRKLVIYIIIFINILVDVYAQAPAGDYVSMKVTEKQDTLLIKRRYGEFWFGGRAGISANKYFGNLNVTNLGPESPFSRTIHYENGNGNGYFFGLLAEWLPPGELWGTSLVINFWDKKNSNTVFTPKDSSASTYEFNSEFNYVTISALARYNLILEGFHVFGGVDLNIPGNHVEKLYEKHQNIQNGIPVRLEQVNFNLGLNVGLGYDFFVADMSEKARAMFTPFASLHIGSSMISDEGSSWNNLQFRFGFAIKIGRDNIQTDTIFLDPNYKAPPEYLASASNSVGVTFPGFRAPQTFVAADLAYVPKSGFTPAKSFKIDSIGKEISISSKRINEINKLLKNPLEPITYNYNSSTSIDLNSKDKKELDLIVDYWKKNPNFEIRIMGYSDDAGTLQENLERSRQRAFKVRQYFVESGVPALKIYAEGAGITNPKAPNNTEAGRRLNRRVELTIKR